MDIHETPAQSETIEQNLGQYGLSTYFTSRFADVGFDHEERRPIATPGRGAARHDVRISTPVRRGRIAPRPSPAPVTEP